MKKPASNKVTNEAVSKAKTRAHTTATSNRKTLAVTAAGMLSIFLAIAFNGTLMAQKREEVATSHPPPIPEVEIRQVHTGTYNALVQSQGEVRARHELILTAEVSGRVVQLHPAFTSGNRVRAGTPLFDIDPTDYQQALASAQSNLANAELALLEEERQAELARVEWQQAGLGKEPESPLVLRQPQLDAAKHAVAQARAQVAAAQRDLDNTQVRAPFDALVVTRQISPGSVIQSGTSVGELHSADQLEVRLPLSASQWQQLPAHDNDQLEVILTSPETTHQWRASDVRREQHLDSNTRERALVAVIDNPLDSATPLFPGSYLSVAVVGKSVPDLWEIPASAIDQSGKYWLVSTEGTLHSQHADIQFGYRDRSYVRPPSGVSQGQVVLRPLNSYLDNMFVRAVEES
ncbi:efflux RND transporter periplasmic adaptor subunit [Microbulbifer agarilyticus]